MHIFFSDVKIAYELGDVKFTTGCSYISLDESLVTEIQIK